MMATRDAERKQGATIDAFRMYKLTQTRGEHRAVVGVE